MHDALNQTDFARMSKHEVSVNPLTTHDDMRTVRIKKQGTAYKVQFIEKGKAIAYNVFSGFATGDMAKEVSKWCEQTPDPTVEEKELTNPTFAD